MRFRQEWQERTEKELSWMVGEGDEEAQLELFRRAGLLNPLDPAEEPPVLTSMSGRYPREVAEEAVLQVQCRLWADLAKFDPERGAIRSWVWKVADNEARQILRSCKRRLRRSGEYSVRTGDVSPSFEDRTLERVVIERSVRAAMPEIREALTPREMEVMIAEARGEKVKGMSPGGHRVLLHKGRKKAAPILRAHLEGEPKRPRIM